MQIRGLATLLVAASAGCAHKAPAQPSTTSTATTARPAPPASLPPRTAQSFACPTLGGPAWIELTSPHFTLRTNVDEPRARQKIQEFEDELATMKPIIEFLLPAAALPSRTSVVLFAYDEDLSHLLPNSGAFFRLSDERRRPLIVTTFGASRVVVRHELLHRLILQRLVGVPPWLNEGLAEYFSNLRIDGEQVTLGVRPERLQQVHAEPLPAGSPLVSPAMLPSVSELVQGDSDLIRSSGAYYVGAWTLVHVLLNSTPGDVVDFRRYVVELDDYDGVSLLLHAFGSFERLERLYRARLQQVAEHKPLREWTFRCPRQLERVTVTVRPLEDGEVHLVRGFLDPPGRWLETGLAAAHAKRSAATYHLLALGLLAQGQPTAALTALASAIKLAPGDPFWRFRALEERLAAELQRPQAARNLAALRGEVQALEPAAQEPWMMTLLARFCALTGQAELGRTFAQRALVLEPRCQECLIALALAQYARGDFEDAMTSQMQAISTSSLSTREQTALGMRYDCYRRHRDRAQSMQPMNGAPTFGPEPDPYADSCLP